MGEHIIKIKKGILKRHGSVATECESCPCMSCECNDQLQLHLGEGIITAKITGFRKKLKGEI